MSKTQFTITEEEVSFVTHELKNPLAAIQLYAELLLGDSIHELNEKQKELAQEILNSNKKVLDLVDEFRKKYKN